MRAHLCRGWGHCAAVGGSSWVIRPHTGSGCWWRRSISPSALLKMLLRSRWAKGQASHAPLSSISSFCLWHSLPPLTLICIPRMPTQSSSRPGTLGACIQRRTLLNKSSSVVPEHDGCGMSGTNLVPLPRIGVWRETELTWTAMDGALWPHIAAPCPAEPNRLSQPWLNVHFILYSNVCAALHKRWYWELQAQKHAVFTVHYNFGGPRVKLTAFNAYIVEKRLSL